MGCSWATGRGAALEVGGLEMGSWGRAGPVAGKLEVVVDHKLCCWGGDCGVQPLLFKASRPSLVPSGLHVALMSCLERGWMQDKERAGDRKWLCVLLEEQIHLPFQSQDVIASSLLLRLEICVTRDVERICGSGGGGEVGFSRHLLWLWAPYWVGPGRLDVQGSAGVVSLVLRMEMCEQEREQVNLAAGQDQNGSQQQGWKWSWAGAHVHTW